jgi:hypothetical protein
VVIKRSARQEIGLLISELDSQDDLRREAAVARLTVIGTRAVDPLLAMLSSAASVTARTSALEVLESIGDVHSRTAVLALLDDENAQVAASAAGAARAFLRSADDTEVLDRLAAVAVDELKPDPVRLAALDALRDLGLGVLGQLWERLRQDPSLAVSQRAARETGLADPLEELEAAAAGAVPETPGMLSSLVEKAGDRAPLSTLHRLVESAASAEATERASSVKAAWMKARGDVHIALARRGSRVALYDLRETAEKSAAPLPPTFIEALSTIGDAASLEALAALFARLDAESHRQSREHIGRAFRAIAQREGVTGRHAVIKRIRARWPEAAAELIPSRHLARRLEGPKS